MREKLGKLIRQQRNALRKGDLEKVDLLGGNILELAAAHAELLSDYKIPWLHDPSGECKPDCIGCVAREVNERLKELYPEPSVDEIISKAFADREKQEIESKARLGEMIEFCHLQAAALRE